MNARIETAAVPTVAVITRTKDRGILLERALKSVHQQTMGDLVHVIINDGGDKKVVDDLVKKYESIIRGRVKVIHNDVSGGMEAASNKAIKSVDSTFVAIHDDDDTWHPNFLSDTMDEFDRTGAEGVIVTVDKIDEEIVGDAVQKLSQERWRELRVLRLYDLCQANFAVPISFIYRRRVFEQIGYYDESLHVCGDWDFALRFMTKYDISLLKTENALAYYHYRPSASGVMGNSIFAGADKHEYFRAKLANKYLRDDLAKGGIGLGYLFNSLQESATQQDRDRKRIDELQDKLQEVIFQRSLYFTKVKRVVKRVFPRIYKRLRD